ncbi:MAG: T9SS type A sorting domain-containing protein [Crocinitomicaceae bacterium]|nr:T9SS type A sorting domain-containing protein [Flavobacteriales bacterium]NQZ35115.1 T9SS type A sorting domain-containing protein [Crocinitomicaceae bacterium]
MSIQSSEELMGMPYEVISITGQVVQSGSLTESLDVSKIDSGIYFLRVKTQNGEVDQRFIMD